MRSDIVERLFSLFAPSDRAETLAGDLMEERQHRGSFWYWLHVIRVTFVLWRCASADAPLRMLALALAACGLFVAPALAGLAAVLLFPQPEPIHVPALGVYAVPISADDFMRRGDSDRPPFPAAFITKTINDSTLRARVEQLYLLTRKRARNHEKWFAAFAEHGRIVEISGAHHLFISNPEDVAREIDGFMTSVVNELSPDRR